MTNESDDDFWKKQYEQAWKTLNEESTRYWTRFNISLVINAGLIIGFSTMLGFLKDFEILATFTSMAIAIMGIIFSITWLRITNLAIKWNRQYASVVKKIEQDKLKKYKILFPENEWTGSIMKTSLCYPIAFLIFWIALTIVFGIYHDSLIVQG